MIEYETRLGISGEIVVLESSVSRIVGPTSVRLEGPRSADRLEYMGLGKSGLKV